MGGEMRSLTLCLGNPLYELPHRVGLQGLAKLLDYCDRTQCLASTSIKWEIKQKEIRISWHCSDFEFFTELQRQAYWIKNGEIDSPCLELEDEERYVFSQGILTSFLQHNTHRKFTEEKQSREFIVGDNITPLQKTVRMLRDYYHLGIPRNVFNKKGEFNKSISLKSNHLPGLLEEKNGAGTYRATIEEFLVLYFLPLATPIYSLPMDSRGNRVALCFFNSNNLLDSIHRHIPRKFIESVTSGGDAGLRVLAHNQERDIYNLDHEVFILGVQQWNSRQKFLKQSVVRIHSDQSMIDLYGQFLTELKPQYRVREKEGEPDKAFISGSLTLGFITDNLIAGKPWHYHLGKYLLSQDYYEKETLIKMIESHTDRQYKDFRTVIQGILFSYYMKSGFYSKARAKIIYALNTPLNQLGFTKAFTQFLTADGLVADDKNRIKLVTELIETDWQLAKDWTLQAIILFVSPSKETNNGQKEKD